MTNANKQYFPSIKESFGMMGKAILIMILFSPILIIKNLTNEKELSLFIFYVCTMGTIFLIFHRKRKKETGAAVYPLQKMPVVMILIIVMLTVTLGIGLTMPIISLIPMPDYILKAFSEYGKQKGAFSFLSVVIAAPILEELIFRGIILDGFLKQYSPVRSILISAFLFGLIHLNPWQFCGAFLIGIFSGWIYYRTRNLLPCILIHFTNNLIVTLINQVADTTANQNQSLTDYYGGTLNVTLIIIVANLLSIGGVFLLNRRMTASTYLSTLKELAALKNTGVDEMRIP